MIQLIIFDNYGVVLHGGYPQTTDFLAKKFNKNQEELYEIIYKKYFNLAAEAKISQQEAWEKSIEETSLPLTVEEIKQVHYSFFELNLEVIEFAKEVSKKVQTLLLTKNTPEQVEDTEKKLSFKKYFKNIINTWELRLPKASKETIKFILNKFKVQPEEVIYVDDQEINLVAAKELGVHTILYQNFEQFKEEIEERL